MRIAPRWTTGLTAIVVVLSGCATDPGSSPSQASLEPSPSANPSTEPTASARPSASAQASETPIPTDPGEPPLFQNLALATVRVNGLALREERSTSAGVVANPYEGEPIRLDAGDHVLVISNAQEAEGRWWVRVMTPVPLLFEPLVGWVAAGSADDPWIEEDNAFCPEPTLAALIELSGIERFGCYGSAPITFDAYPAVLPPDAGLGGACILDVPDAPAWLLCDHTNYSWVNPDVSTEWGFQLHWDPATGLEPVELVPEGEPVPHLRITGHFNDPAAEDCDLVAENDQQAEVLPIMCAGLFVVDAVEEL